MLWLLLAIPLCVALHVSAMAGLASMIGVTVREVSVGLGPTLIRLGRFRLGLVPISGHVRLRSTREEDVPAEEIRSALEGGSLARQISLVLAGPLFLLALALAISGLHALAAFMNLPWQVIAGATSPFGAAQTMLGDAASFLRSASPTLILGVVISKFACLNLLPLPSMNGGAALATLGRAIGVARFWPQSATSALLFVWLGVLVLWLLALVVRLSGA